MTSPAVVMSLELGRSRSEHLERKLCVVEHAPLFRGVTPLQRREIASHARELEFRRKQRVLEQGESLQEVVLVGSGRLKTTVAGPGGQEVILRLAGPGEVVGGLWPSAGRSSPVGAEAIEAGHALAWDRHVLTQLLDRAPVLHRNALDIVGERLRRMEERYLELCTERVPVRLARTLLRLLGQIGRPTQNGVVIALSRQDMALMIGTTPFTVSRLLSKWEAAGMLRAGRESVFIDDATALANLTGDTDGEPGSSGASG